MMKKIISTVRYWLKEPFLNCVHVYVPFFPKVYSDTIDSVISLLMLFELCHCNPFLQSSFVEYELL